MYIQRNMHTEGYVTTFFAVLNHITIIWPLMTFIDIHTSRIVSITIAPKLGMLELKWLTFNWPLMIYNDLYPLLLGLYARGFQK